MNLTEMVVVLAKGLAVSVEVFACTLAVALPLGLLLACGRMSRNVAIAVPVRGFISVFRRTPLLLQLLFVYFAPPVLFGLTVLDGGLGVLATIVVFSFNFAAEFAEIYRGGVLSVDRKQIETAVSLGLPRRTRFLRVVMPQVVKRVIPAVGNLVSALVGNTSLAFVLAVAGMLTNANRISADSTTLALLIAAGVFYYVFNRIVAWCMGRLERRYGYFDI